MIRRATMADLPRLCRTGMRAFAADPVIDQVGTRAAEQGLPLYLATETVENVAYYSHLGFVVRSEWDVPLGGPHMWGMFRPAQ